MNWAIETLNIPQLWQKGLQGEGIRVGHLDSGIDGRHMAFRKALKGFRYFDRNGFPIPKRIPMDENGHGTHTAGIICSTSQGAWMGGVAPKASLFSAAVIEEGSTLVRLINALQWMIENKVRLVNISVGVLGWNPILRPMIRELWRHDILPIGVIGNDGVGQFRAPGCYPEVFCVGAIDQNGIVPKFSGSLNEGLTCLKPDVLAPGVAITSVQSGDEYDDFSGTSSAAAYCSGVAALLFQSCPGASARQVAFALEETAQKMPEQQAHRSRLGCIQPMAALDYLQTHLEDQCSFWPDQPDQNLEELPYHDPAIEKALKWVDDDFYLEVIFYSALNANYSITEIIDNIAIQLKEQPRRVRYLHRVGIGFVLASKRFIISLKQDRRVEMISHAVGKVPEWSYQLG